MTESDDENLKGTKYHVKIRGRSHLQEWKDRTLALANKHGFKDYLLNSIPVNTDHELEVLEDAAYNEADLPKREKALREVRKKTRQLKKHNAACCMMTMSVSASTLKKLSKHADDPKAMYDAIIEKYGKVEGDGALEELIAEFDSCTLSSNKENPDDWFKWTICYLVA